MEEFVSSLSPWLEKVYFGNTVEDYLVALAILLGFWIFFKFLKSKVFRGLGKLAKKTKTDLDDRILEGIQTIPEPLYFFGSLYISFHVIKVHPLIIVSLQVILIILATYCATSIAAKTVEYSLGKLADKKGLKKEEKDTTSMALIFAFKLILWTLGFLLVLSNLGVNISALIASLGIGGIAVALATQNILADMFGSFTIYLDRPFEIGDYIVIGDHSGTVKKIGLKSTRIEALQGEEIIISNKELTNSRVRNFKRMKKRRITYELAVAPETKITVLNKIPETIQKVVKKFELIEFERAHLKALDINYKFEIVYHINTIRYREYIDIQQKINLELLKTFHKEKIDVKGAKEIV